MGEPVPPAPRRVSRDRARQHRARDAQSFSYQPGLDGLRALALLAVCFYHARFGWAGGGFLGVSLFFTLSGFLITSLVVRERYRLGRVDLRGFWARRFRRLLPASLATQGLVVALAALGVFSVEQLRPLRNGIFGTLSWVANWQFVAAGVSYGDRFAAPSPVEHFWSLAVEEQFYVLFPLMVVVLLRLGSARRRVVAVPLVALCGASWWWCHQLAATNVQRAYFGTDTRAGELLAGALLALAFARATRFRRTSARWAADVLGVLALVGLGALWRWARVDATWLYPGGLVASSVAAAALITAALQGGVVAKALAVQPLRALGKISYGVYLLHWPVFLALTAQRLPIGPWPLFGVRMAVTILGAMVMFWVLEEPVRRQRGWGRWLARPRPAAVLGAIAVGAILAGTVAVTTDLPAQQSLTRQPATRHTAPQQVLVIGDQFAASVAAALQSVPGRRVVTASTVTDCGLGTGGYVRLPNGEIERDTDRCSNAHQTWLDAESSLRPDVVVIVPGLRDAADRRLDRAAPWLKPGDADWQAFLRTSVAELADGLAAGGARLVWLTLPPMSNAVAPTPVTRPPARNDDDRRQRDLEDVQAKRGVPEGGFAENDPSRLAVVNQTITDLVATRSDSTSADLSAEVARFTAQNPVSTENRPDGVVLGGSLATDVGKWLVSLIGKLRRATSATAAAPEAATQVTLPAAPAATPRRTVPAGTKPAVLVVGDSVAAGHGLGLLRWTQQTNQIQVDSYARFGCPVARGGLYRFLGQTSSYPTDCDWATTFPFAVNDRDPDVVVLSTGVWDVVDRVLPGETRWHHIGEPIADTYFESELLTAIDALAAQGARVAVLTAPRVEAGMNQGYSGEPESDPARMARLNELIREAADLRPGVVTVIEFGAWLEQQPGSPLDTDKRTDGIHFTDAYERVIGAWLGPQLVAISRGS